jgi:hypothetical protein
MPYYIKSEESGLFVGECLGFGFYEANIEDGDCSPEEEPVPFSSREEAQRYMDSWVGGIPKDHSIIYKEV